MGAGSWTPVLYESGEHSQLLSQLSSPHLVFLKTHLSYKAFLKVILLYGYEETGSQVALAGLQLACCVAESDLELVTLLCHCLHADIAGVPLTPGSFFSLKLSNTILSIF